MTITNWSLLSIRFDAAAFCVNKTQLKTTSATSSNKKTGSSILWYEILKLKKMEKDEVEENRWPPPRSVNNHRPHRRRSSSSNLSKSLSHYHHLKAEGREGEGERSHDHRVSGSTWSQSSPVSVLPSFLPCSSLSKTTKERESSSLCSLLFGRLSHFLAHCWRKSSGNSRLLRRLLLLN